MAGIYIHIPFCRKKCAYCDFVSFSNMTHADVYFVALISEIRRYAPLMRDRRFDTVFIGGGTPTVLQPVRISTLIDEIRKSFALADTFELTVEANPESLSGKMLKELSESGVTRLSIGLQSADDKVLKAIGRIHTQEVFISAFRRAQEAGFANINVDVMHGLPLQNQESYVNTLRLVTDLGAQHISSYSLILEENTPLLNDVSNGRIILPDDDETADMEDAGFVFLKENGYVRYEVSNFALSGMECRHNLNYWDNGEYLGLGLNSHSAMSVGGKWTRWENTSNITEYISELGNAKLPVRNTRSIEKDEEMFETVMLGLRKCSGVSRTVFLNRFGIDPAVQYASAISELFLDDMIIVDDNRIYLTDKGFDFQNEVLLRFMD